MVKAIQINTLLAALGLCLTAGTAHAAVFEDSIQPFLAKNCYACHSAGAAMGNLNLQAYKTAEDAMKDRVRWESVLKKLEAGEMPPPAMPQPAKTDVAMVTQWIEAEFEKADRTAVPDPGRVTARRLNRLEYNNTIRDLLGVVLEPADDFPQDNSVYGFDNIADALTLSPLLMEKYMAAAETIAQTAVIGVEMAPLTQRWDPPNPRRRENNPVELKSDPYYSPQKYDETGFAHPGAFHLDHLFPADGEYLIEIRANGDRPPGSDPMVQMLDFYLDGKLVDSFEVPQAKTATNENLPVFMETRVKVKAGRHKLISAFPKQYEGLPARFEGPNPSSKPEPAPDFGRRFQPPPGATPEEAEAQRKRIEALLKQRANQPYQGYAVMEFVVTGPFEHHKEPAEETTKLVYAGCGHLHGEHTDACPRKIIANLAYRAYRRPLAEQEVDRLTAVFDGAVARGRSFKQGVALALQAILVSPDFLFRIENDQASAEAQGSPLTPHELASRLSYFLWSSMPDAALFAKAESGALRDKATLEKEVRRMLADDKAKALARSFAGQWLETRRLESMQPDRDRYPDFDDYLRQSMMTETRLFFDEIARQDGSILDFIDGKYTFLNERLALHYGIDGVKGADFRKVALPADSHRGGIIGQASVLAVSSYNNRTSPVLRGKWVLENILNSPPPPPPPNVPTLEENQANASASLREQLEKHRENAACASCHSRLDPLGFALENFDVIGSWRTQDGGFEIDASGTLPNGTQFEGPEGLRTLLLKDKDNFTAGFAEKLFIYALGRGVEGYDRTVLRQIVDRVAEENYKFSSLVMGIVESVPFQRRKGSRGEA